MTHSRSGRAEEAKAEKRCRLFLNLLQIAFFRFFIQGGGTLLVAQSKYRKKVNQTMVSEPPRRKTSKTLNSRNVSPMRQMRSNPFFFWHRAAVTCHRGGGWQAWSSAEPQARDAWPGRLHQCVTETGAPLCAARCSAVYSCLLLPCSRNHHCSSTRSRHSVSLPETRR